jgi:hypothetical protein
MEGGAAYAPNSQGRKLPTIPRQGTRPHSGRQASSGQQAQATDDLPEGLRRERTHPLNPLKEEAGTSMPKPPKPMSEPDQKKAGLQDDHDPQDIGQKQNDKPRGDSKPSKKPAGPYDRDSGVDSQGLPEDESKFG